MAITINGVPTTVRTPGVYAEIDNSRALKGLIANPYRAVILGQKCSAGSADLATLKSVTSEAIADSYFGAGSILSRMCRIWKQNNPNTELYAIALSDGAGVAASAVIHFSVALSHTTGSVSVAGTTYLMINGSEYTINLTALWSIADVNSAAKTLINANSNSPVHASTNATSALCLSAVNSGTLGNYINVQFNYYDGEAYPDCFTDSVLVSAMAGGTTDPSLADAWAVLGDQQYHVIVNPYIDSTNLTSLETELADRFKPLEDLAGMAFTGVRATLASCTTLGNTRNSPHNTIVGANGSPTGPEEWAAAWAAQAAAALNSDPARPLQGIALNGVLPPKVANWFTRAERDIILYDGIATWTVSGGKVLMERSITTYQTNTLGIADPSYLDVETLATLIEIRYQFKARMSTRFISPRFKLADDTFPVQPGSFVATPKTVKQEIIALFTALRDRGLVDNIDEFIENLVVERDATDTNRVNVLLPPDLINQFRILAGLVQFIL